MRRAAALLLVAPLAVAGGCGGGGGGAAASRGCQPEVREKLDPNSGRHLLPGADVPEFRSDPPTSGAHLLGRWPRGVLDEPITPEVQVTMLEEGEVLLQHRDLSADELSSLVALAGENVTVAPGPDLPDRVVATAWTYKQVCRRVDDGALRRFIDEHAGKGA